MIQVIINERKMSEKGYSQKLEKGSLKSTFLMTAVVWLLFAHAVLVFRQELSVSNELWLIAFWLFCLFDLFTLSKTVAATMNLMSDQVHINSAHSGGALFWGALKICCLGSIGVVLFFAKSVSISIVLLGMSTMLVVPLAVGFCWSKKELEHA